MKTAKAFVIPALLFIYLASVVFARSFWANIFGKLMVSILDLSPNQGWMLPVAFHVAAALIGAPQLAIQILSLRRGERFPITRHIAFSLCLAAVSLCVWGALAMSFVKQKELASSLNEFGGGEAQQVFDAGTIFQNSYSNHFIAVTLDIPTNWHPASLNSIYRGKEAGARAAFGNTDTAKEAAATREGTYPLLVFRQYPEGFPGFNPSLSLSAYDKRIVKEQSLADYAANYGKIGGPFQIVTPARKQTVGWTTGYYLRIEAHFSRGTIQQDVYLAETTNFYLVMVASVLDENDFVPINAAISTFRISK